MPLANAACLTPHEQRAHDFARNGPAECQLLIALSAPPLRDGSMFDWLRKKRATRAGNTAVTQDVNAVREVEARRKVKVGDREMVFHGLSIDDPYLQLVSDGFENGFHQFCCRYLRGDAVAMDIGANIGVTASLISQSAPRGLVHAFEPAQTVFPLLVENLACNNLTRVRAHNVALSDKSGASFFHAQSAYGYMTSNPAGGHPIRTCTIDDFVHAESLQRLDFVKIDVEGFEQAVLDGAINSIARFSPLFFMEFNSWCLIAHS